MLTAAGGSNTFSFTANAAMIGNTYYANVLVTDAGSGSANSIKSGQITVNAALGQPTISPSIATAYDNGATITIATYETGGTSPYTYNFLVFNSITNVLIANMLTAAGGSNTFSFTANAAMIGNTYYANVLVTDAGSGSANSIKSGQITVNAALGQPTISPSIATAYDNGATITIATYETGGTTPYTYNFLVFNSITNVLIANMLTAAGGSNTFSFTANAAMIGNTYYANVLVTDAGSGSANSIKSGQITVNAALGQPTISPSIATAYDNGATITIATYETGGTTPYTYNFLVFNSITNVLIANMLTAAGGSNTFSFTANAAMIGNTYYANVLVTDAGSGSANSIKSGQITVNAALGQPTISPSIATAYDNGATITIATYETGGTTPYTYNFLVFNSITNVLIANMLTAAGGSNTFSFTANAAMIGNTYYANVLVTDAGSGSANSIKSGQITVNAALGQPTISPSIATAYDNGATITIATYETGGTTPYTYNFLVFNSITNVLIANMLTAAGGSNTFSFTANAAMIGNTYYANVLVTDAGSGSANSIKSGQITVNAALGQPTISPSIATAYDNGATITIATYETGGTSPYTYNFLVFNSITNVLIANMLTAAGGSNTFSFTANAAMIGNTYYANVLVTDAGSGSANSIKSGQITVNAALGQPTISPSIATAYDNGATITIATYETGGTSPYTYNFLVFNSITNVLIANMLTAAGGSNTFSFTANAAMIGNTYYANVLVTDAGSGSANSIKSGQITVNAALGQPTISPSIATAYDNGATITIATYETGGTSPYTYNFLVFNSITNVLIANMLTAAGGSNTFSFTANAAMIGNTYYANVLVTDAGSGSANSIKSGQITVNAALGQPTISPSIATAYDNGATITIATYETGGTSPYTYNFLVFNSITNVLIANMLTAAGGSNTFSFTANAAMIGNTYYANVLVTDAGSGSANSIKSGQITVNAALGQPTISPSIATAYDNGATITIATYETGGTSPYTYNFLVFNSITNVLIANMLTAAGGSNTFSFTANAAMIGNTYYANVLVTDAGSGSANSIKSGQITVNAALGQPTISPSIATAYDNGATITIATYETGGTSPYTYNFLVFNSITNVLIANMLTAAGGSNTFSFTANAAMIGNTYYANVLVTDADQDPQTR